MTIKTVLAPVFGDANDARVLAWGAAMTRGFDAVLDGLFVRPSAESASDFLGPAFSTYGLEGVLDVLDKAGEAARDAAREAYEAATAALPADAAGVFRDRLGEPRACLAEEARLADLIVAAAPRGGADDPRWERFEALVLGGTRPVLSAPDAAELAEAFKTIVVAWDGGPEAARAAAAAAPFLTRAKSVTVLHVGDEAEDLEPLAAFARWLDRHGVESAGRTCPAKGRGEGVAILEEADALKPDLVVMGAFGHSRWPLRQLRGATSHAAKHALWPVLFTH